MLNRKFVYVLTSPKINKTVHKNNPRTHSPKQKKSRVDGNCQFQSLYSRNVAEKINTYTEMFVY